MMRKNTMSNQEISGIAIGVTIVIFIVAWCVACARMDDNG